MVSVHVGEFAVVHEQDALLAQLLSLSNVCRDDALGLFLKPWIPRHLQDGNCNLGYIMCL